MNDKKTKGIRCIYRRYTEKEPNDRSMIIDAYPIIDCELSEDGKGLCIVLPKTVDGKEQAVTIPIDRLEDAIKQIKEI